MAVRVRDDLQLNNSSDSIFIVSYITTSTICLFIFLTIIPHFSSFTEPKVASGFQVVTHPVTAWIKTCLVSAWCTFRPYLERTVSAYDLGVAHTLMHVGWLSHNLQLIPCRPGSRFQGTLGKMTSGGLLHPHANKACLPSQFPTELPFYLPTTPRSDTTLEALGN